MCAWLSVIAIMVTQDTHTHTYSHTYTQTHTCTHTDAFSHTFAYITKIIEKEAINWRVLGSWERFAGT